MKGLGGVVGELYLPHGFAQVGEVDASVAPPALQQGAQRWLVQVQVLRGFDHASPGSSGGSSSRAVEPSWSGSAYSACGSAASGSPASVGGEWPPPCSASSRSSSSASSKPSASPPPPSETGRSASSDDGSRRPPIDAASAAAAFSSRSMTSSSSAIPSSCRSPCSSLTFSLLDCSRLRYPWPVRGKTQALESR